MHLPLPLCVLQPHLHTIVNRVDGAGAHCQGAVQLLPAAACIVSVNRWRQPRPSLSGVSASSSKPSTRSDNSLCLSGSTVLLMLYVYSCQYNSV